MNAVTPLSLPVDEVLPALRRALETSRACVLEAPPGAGKTTRVPLALLDAPWLAGRRIIMLEPRRLAARAAAHFMAAQLNEPVGATVGYRVRLDSRVGPRTRIEVVTEGVLARLLQDDPALEGVGLVIFDEFHERSLHADLGLALCLDAQRALREDLRLLVMSATLDGAAVAHLLGDAPVIASAGRAYPVELRYAPPATGRGTEPDRVRHLVSVVRRVVAEEPGSVLAFLPGTGEIRRAERLLAEAGLPGDVMLAPLYGDLPQEAQDQAIRPPPPGVRKVVLATSIAETSLTIEGVRVVVDSGLARAPRFDPVSGLTRLVTLNISKAAAAQRAGRAGRLGPGVCYRLWSEEAQRSLQDFARPEIMEADLAPLALDLAAWGVSDPARLSWLDPPPTAAYAQARELLIRLDALDHAGRVTAHGRAMAGLGLHPRLAHMMLAGHARGWGALACELAALLGERDILKGVREADVRVRLEVLRGTDDAPGTDRAACRRALKSAEQWRRQLGIKDRPSRVDAAHAGALLALAYPDRIAQRRPGGEPRYRLANGRGAYFAADDALATQDYVVAVELDGEAREARIFLAAALTRDEIETHCAARIEEREFIEWDGREQAVRARRQRCLDELILDDAPLANPDSGRVTGALAQGIREMGLSCLPWTPALEHWRERVMFLHRLDAGAWPDVSGAALLATLESWLVPSLHGLSRRAHLANLDLQAVLTGLLDYPRQRRLDELAPTHFTVPSGSRIAIDYGNDPPVLAVRLQEMFGVRATPAIAGGRVALLLHLLSPAGRPVQVTRDIEGFWAKSYHEVKKELKGRYPKHAWPDDPLTAMPTARAKRRGAE